MILDAGVYSAVGNTPGKALLGLKVTTLNGSRLSYAEYSRRNPCFSGPGDLDAGCLL
jgi:RDD family.